MILKVLLIAVMVGGLAGILANAGREDPNSYDFLDAKYEASRDGTEQPKVADNWPEEQPILFGGAVGVGVFVIGLLVVVAINSSPPDRR